MSHLTPRGDIATNVTMKTIVAILIALSACADDVAYSPDAAPIDAQHADARPQPDSGPDLERLRACMGNLPGSRTITINPGDPIPGSIIGELQDQIIGAKRKAWSRPRGPGFTLQGSWAAPSLVTDSLGKTLVASVSTAGGVTGYIEIPFDEGDRIIGLSLQVCGNGAANSVFDVWLGTTAAGLVSIAGGGYVDVARPNTWATLSAITITPTVLAAGNTLYLSANPSAAGYNLAAVIPQFDRL